jgi:hypothetical protein
MTPTATPALTETEWAGLTGALLVIGGAIFLAATFNAIEHPSWLVTNDDWFNVIFGFCGGTFFLAWGAAWMYRGLDELGWPPPETTGREHAHDIHADNCC